MVGRAGVRPGRCRGGGSRSSPGTPRSWGRRISPPVGGAGGRWHQPGRHPPRWSDQGRFGRHFSLRADGGRRVRGRVPADRRGRGEAAGRAGSVRRSGRLNTTETAEGLGGGEEPDRGPTGSGRTMSSSRRGTGRRPLLNTPAGLGWTPATVVIITFDLQELLKKTGQVVNGTGRDADPDREGASSWWMTPPRCTSPRSPRKGQAPEPGPVPMDRVREPDHRPDRPRPRLFIPRL